MLSFIGGTGPEGLGLAFRFLLAGEDVTIGSRREERALEAAEKLESMLGPNVRGAGKPQGTSQRGGGASRRRYPGDRALRCPGPHP